MKASVIIPVYNRKKLIRHCLNYLLNQTVNEYEVIVVDDCSTDGTFEYLQNLNDPRLRNLRTERRSGPYKARNLGIDRAGGELIIFIDSDVMVFPDFIEDHLNAHSGSTDIVLQGMVRHVESVDSVDFNRYFFPNALCIGTFITQNVSVRKRWLAELGVFDDFGPLMGYKDVDMGFRLRDIGLKWKHGFLTCRAFHIDGIVTAEDIENIFRKKRKQGTSAHYFVEKWGKRGERHARTQRTLFLSKLLLTDKWFEKKGVKKTMLKSKHNFGIMWRILKGIGKIHYRKKGIKERMK